MKLIMGAKVYFFLMRTYHQLKIPTTTSQVLVIVTENWFVFQFHLEVGEKDRI